MVTFSNKVTLNCYTTVFYRYYCWTKLCKKKIKEASRTEVLLASFIETIYYFTFLLEERYVGQLDLDANTLCFFLVVSNVPR